MTYAAKVSFRNPGCKSVLVEALGWYDMHEDNVLEKDGLMERKDTCRRTEKSYECSTDQSLSFTSRSEC